MLGLHYHQLLVAPEAHKQQSSGTARYRTTLPQTFADKKSVASTREFLLIPPRIRLDPSDDDYPNPAPHCVGTVAVRPSQSQIPSSSVLYQDPSG